MWFRFRYPTASARSIAYVSPRWSLRWAPTRNCAAWSFQHPLIRCEEFPELVADGDVAVVALLAKRTFWEKATILHAESTAA